MKRLSFVVLLALVMGACSSPKTQEEAAVQSFGAAITEEGSVALTALPEQLATTDSLSVKVEGTIQEVCQMKGCWMKMDMGNNQSITVKFKDYAFFVPKDAAGKVAVIEGVVRKEVTSVEQLKHLAEDAGKSQEEIDAITEPKEGYTFEAAGVLLKDAK